MLQIFWYNEPGSLAPIVSEPDAFFLDMDADKCDVPDQ
jgi:hypothetical protein